eukprot:5878570-Ditylum_brightwellii.AAC.1
MMFLTPRQQEWAKVTRKTLEALGTPSIQDLKAMIQMNLICDNEVTTKGVDPAEQAFGPDLGAIKGKTTRQRPNPINNNRIEIPEELILLHEEVTISINGLK